MNPAPGGLPRLGVHPVAGGAMVAVHAGHADAVEFCLFDAAGSERRTSLPHRTHGVWHGFVSGAAVGDRYGVRVHGAWDPARGHRHNPAKLLVDPYTRALTPPHSARLTPEMFGHHVGPDLLGDVTIRDDRDSAPFAPLGIITGESIFDWAGDRPPATAWTDTVLYEAHVRGLSKRHPAVPPELQGTYGGLAHPAIVEHFVHLGVTAIELLPVQAHLAERPLAARGATNYWGYSPLAYFAPHPGYAATSDPTLVTDEFRGMVKALHSAGIEVILDVVYNHTCESDVTGPTVSWRGLDSLGYYSHDGAGELLDVTGCGNTLDASSFPVVQMVLDSLRYWVSEMHVDGFRFDLATTLGRRRDGYDPDHPLLTAMRADPVIGSVKLIAEPWDVGPGGWRTGGFPAPFAEWNDRYRDAVRDFWLTGGRRAAEATTAVGGVSELATRLAGSADVFSPGRGPNASINFVTAHDGFTLADLVAYDRKHNDANGEGGRDGTDANRSWNHGPEGPTDDPAISEARLRSSLNLLSTLALSAGVPMLTAGDELGRSQGGNNNPYCLDDETTWIDWTPSAASSRLTESLAALLRLRRDHPALGRDRFFTGARPGEGGHDLLWFDVTGREMDDTGWGDPTQRTLQVHLHDAAEPLHLVFCGAHGSTPVGLPASAAGARVRWASAPVAISDDERWLTVEAPAVVVLSGATA